jgi:hypothetical protein
LAFYSLLGPKKQFKETNNKWLFIDRRAINSSHFVGYFQKQVKDLQKIDELFSTIFKDINQTTYKKEALYFCCLVWKY